MCAAGLSTFTHPIARVYKWSMERGPVTGEALVAILEGLLRKTLGITFLFSGNPSTRRLWRRRKRSEFDASELSWFLAEKLQLVFG